MAILLAGGTIAAGILGQYLFFDYNMRKIVTSVKIQRTLSRSYVNRGTILRVTSSITFSGLLRMHVHIADLPPKNTILVDGVTSVTTRPDPLFQTHECSYRIIPVIHGLYYFSGVSVTMRNLFFEDTIQLTRASEREPVLSVQPSGLFAAPSSELGTRDNRKASVWSGVDVHSLREYSIGDDLHHVDWKMSAKYDKIFIRKYTAPMSHPPLIIVDLPWCDAPYPEKEFNRMISDVTGLAKNTIETKQYVSILLISGPNILHLIREEKNISRCISTLREWLHPAKRPVHFYHMPDRSDLRFHVRDCEEAQMHATNSKTLAFYELLRDRYTSILQYQRTPAFTGQVARTISQLLMTEAYIFSLGVGDSSHIRHVVRPLKNQNIKVNLRIMGAKHSGKSGLRVHPADVQEIRT